MSAVAALKETRLSVEPGGEVTTTINVANTGGIVDEFGIDVVGVPAEWVVVEPPVLSLFPDSQQAATVTFRPPRSFDVIPGSRPYAVRVVPSNDPGGAVAEEGTLAIAEFVDIVAEMSPTVVEARVGTHVNVAVDSRGNFPVRVRLLAADPAAALEIRPKPEYLDLMPNQASFSTVHLRPRYRHLRGANKQNRFKVIVDRDGTALQTIDGTMVQRPLLPRFAMAVLILAALAAIWLFLMRPVIRNTATAATQNALSAQAARSNQAAAAASKASAGAAAAASQANQASKSAASVNKKLNALLHKKPAPTTTTTTVPPSFISGPFETSLSSIVAPGSDGQSTWQLPSADPSFALTDLVVDSLGPGNAGQVRIELLTPGSAPRTLIEMNLAQLANVPFQDARFQTPISLNAGQSIAMNVVCLSTGGGGCDVGLLFSGSLTSPAPATTTTVPSSAPPST